MRRGLVILLASLTVALILSEAGLRLVGAFAPPPPFPVPRRPDLYRQDPELGHTLQPSSRMTYRVPPDSDRDLTLVSNQDGFRSHREFDEPDSRPRVWVLGDSMVLGDGVNAEDRFTNLLEQLEPGWRVENLGMSGWGLDLMVRAFERVSRRVTPNLVVVAFYTDDFRRLTPFYSGPGYPFPKFELADGDLVTVPYPSPLPAWRRLRVIQAVEQTYWRLGRNRFALNRSLLDRLKALTDQRSRLAVLFLPGRGDTDEDKRRRAFLGEWCGTTGTPFLDLTDVIHAGGSDPLHIPGNSHWNERGHEVAAQAIHLFLKATRLVL